MGLTAKTLDARELPTTIATLYTVAAGTTTRVTELLLCNNAGAARTVTLHFVNSAGSAGDDNAIAKAWSLPQGMPVPLALNTYLDTGDFIRGVASGVDVAIRISGLEET